MTAERAGGPVRVSILEEDGLLREGLSRELSTAGLEVVAAHDSAASFIDQLATERPNVAVMDLGPRGGRGTELVRLACARVPYLQILVVSGGAGLDAEECLRSGAAGYLDRHSAGRQAFLDAVQAVARGERLAPIDALGLGPGSSAPAPEPEPLRSLSPREREVLSWVASGADNLKIAALLGITERTVKAHVSNLYRKLGQRNRTRMALLAEQLGVRPPPQR